MVSRWKSAASVVLASRQIEFYYGEKKKEGGGKKISFRRYLSVTALGPIEKAWHGQKEKPERRNKAEQ